MKSALFALFPAMLLFTACGGKDKPPAQTFDRRAMLERYADALIIPAFERLQTQTASLQSIVQLLVENPSQMHLDAAQAAWRQTLLDWQDVNAFNFGPAGEAGTRKGLAEEFATFPVNTILIDQYAAAADTSFNNFNRDTRGLLALDYLLFATSDAEVLSWLNDPNYRTYLLGVANQLDRQIDTVVTAWRGSYRAQFIANDGADVGSSISALYNEFVRSYEQLKNFKVGLPLGKRIGQSATEPSKVEAYFSGQSLQAMEAHFEALVRIWRGAAPDGSLGTGFRAYLDDVEGGSALIPLTENQIAVISHRIDELLALNQPLSQLITNTPTVVEPLYADLSQHTRFWKSDMSSLLGISITFASGDGD